VARGDAGALPCQEAGSSTVGRGPTPEPSRDEWWVWSHGAHGDTRALPRREVGLVPWYTW
jgi:hypothetical protein